MSEPQSEAAGKTMLRRIEQYRDRWSSYGSNTGIVALSDKLSPEELRRFEIFDGYDDRFLERISPDVSVVSWREGAVLFEQGSYLDLAFVVTEGEVEVFLEGVAGDEQPRPIFDVARTSFLRKEDLDAARSAEASQTTFIPTVPPDKQDDASHEITFLATMDFDLPRGAVARLGTGEIFGEIGAMTGWPMSVTARTASACKLVQIRLPALRLMKRKSSSLKERLDALYRKRTLVTQLKSTPLLRDVGELHLEALKESVELVSAAPGESVLREGQAADALYLVRSGFVKLSQRFGEDDLTVTYLSKGMTFGETELLLEEITRWETSAEAVEYLELVKIPAAVFRDLMGRYPEIEQQLWGSAVARLKEVGFSKRNFEHASFTQIALDRGLVQGSSMLVIDLESCTRCDDCVRACAATHGGRPRFVREGDKVESLLVAKSCYHCRDPVCLVGCPTGAIHRAGVADVVEIDDGICIGCGTCANNCPYDAIMMHDTGETWPEDMVPVGLRGTDRRVASKCDLCHGTGHDPACVSNCPQGCAYRVGGLDEIRDLIGRES